MVCSHCQKEIADLSNYCSVCGTRQQSTTSGRRLTRSATDSKIAGVCGGIAEYFNVDPTIVRLAWVILSVIPGCVFGGLLAYLAAWIIVPKGPLSSYTPPASFANAAKSS